MFKLLACNVKGTEVNQHKVIVCTSRNKVEASVCQTLCKRLSVLYDLFAVILEFRIESLSEAHRL